MAGAPTPTPFPASKPRQLARDLSSDNLGQHLAEELSEGLIIIDPSGEVILWNQAAQSLLGEPVTRLPQGTEFDAWASVRGWLDANELIPISYARFPWGQLLSCGRPSETELWLRSSDSLSRGRRLLVRAVYLDPKRSEHVALLARELSSPAVAATTHESRELFETAFAASPAAMAISSIEDGRFIDANDNFLRLLGYRRDELIGHTTFDLKLWPSLTLRDRLAKTLARTGSLRDQEVQIQGKSGQVRDILASFELIHWRGKACVLGMATDVSARKSYERGLEQARWAADAANRAKSEFLANMSHEMRTPLSAILGYLELLGDALSSEGQDGLRTQLEYLQRVRCNVTHLHRLIDDILDLSKIEAGKLSTERVPFSLAPELINTLRLLETQAKAKGLAMDAVFSTSIPQVVHSDPQRLRQILLNVVGNAIKFTDAGSVCVEVSMVAAERTDPGERQLSFTVKDSGCGMTFEEQRRVFEPFIQADSSITRRYGGTGLGLTLSRRLARELGGNLEILRSTPREGSVFRFTIAVGDVTTAGWLTADRLEETPERALAPRWVPSPRPRLDGVRVLLVEDGQDNREVIAQLLETSGARVVVARDGAEGVSKAQEAQSDVILMDVQMPVLGGEQAMCALRSRGLKTPIVALTAAAMKGDRERFLSAGFDDYLTKPFNPTQLLETIGRHAKPVEAKPPPFPITQHEDHMEKATQPMKDESGPLYSLYAGDPKIQPILGAFIDRLPQRAAALREAIGRGDRDELARLAHQMKGAAGGYGYPILSDIAARLERAAREAEADATALLVEFDRQIGRAAAGRPT